MENYNKSEAQAFGVALNGVVQALKDLVRPFEEGTIRLEADGHALSLMPGGIMWLKIEGSSRPDKQKLEIKLSWNPAEQAAGSELRISANGGGGGEGNAAPSPFGG